MKNRLKSKIVSIIHIIICLVIFQAYGNSQIIQASNNPDIRITPGVEILEDCKFAGQLSIELLNFDVTNFPLPYEIDLEYLEDGSETYYDMTEQNLLISDLLAGSYSLEIYYSEACSEIFTANVVYSNDGIKATIWPDKCAENSSVGLYNCVFRSL